MTRDVSPAYNAFVAGLKSRPYIMRHSFSSPVQLQAHACEQCTCINNALTSTTHISTTHIRQQQKYTYPLGFRSTRQVAPAPTPPQQSSEWEKTLENSSQVTRHTLHVTRHTLQVTRYTLHVTRHTSHATRHTSHVSHLAIPPRRVHEPPPHPLVKHKLQHRHQRCTSHASKM